MRVFRRRPTYFRSLPSVFIQAQFAEFEDQIIEAVQPTRPTFSPFPTVDLQFSLDDHTSRVDIARVLYVFRRIYNVKPVLRFGKHGGYRMVATFPVVDADNLLGYFMHLQDETQTKYLHFFFQSESHDFQFLLFEPITFFPLIHRAFDYHDWVYPFEFMVSFTPFDEHRQPYLAETLRDVFDTSLYF